ncbi:MAG: RagB/SusD family nutrient uptake outer membrane protein [Bacteroidales bacterium]|nr:RagB/SusD family nutrient uptake outer membrane protein [Bacteroidales bacterium]MBR5041923.1 RagB/SusD family nutrient uptake outer membrane protein [Bacteroidales bacterium]
MKKILFSILIVLAGFSFAGCDDLLDAVPKDKMTTDTFFKSESELKAFAMNFYGMFPGTELYIANDDHYTQNNPSNEVMGKRTVPASGSGWSWGALRNVNTLLEYLPNCKDETARTQYEALARFFRAYFYFEKVKRFGDVPWYDKPVGSKDEEALNRPRDPREFIMQRMIEDIDFAIANLPSGKSAYEVTKWTAMALKSRFLLFEGTFRKYHTEFNYGADAKDYKWYLDLCAQTSYEFIQSSGYSLHKGDGPNSGYHQLFTTFSAEELTDEVILARNYNKAYGAYHNSNYTMNTGSMGCPSMTKKLAASYLCKDGSRFTDIAGWDSKLFGEETQNRDPRMAQSIRTPGYKRMGEEDFTAPDFKVTFTGYHPDKYVTTIDQDTYNNADIDLIIFRAGEVLLNYAEAKAEAGTLTQDNLDLSVNKLRDRVGMPHMDMAAANANPDPFLTDKAWGGYQNVNGANKGVILEIRRERAIELAQEGHRYYDIIRWKEGKVFEAPFYGMYFPGEGVYDLDGNGTPDIEIFSEAATSKAPVQSKLGTDIILKDGNSGLVRMHSGITCTWNEDRDYLYPIPTDERNLTHGALTQNPGWDDGLNF